MGQVYLATDTKLKRQVAIKILPPSLAADPERLARIFGLEESGGMTALVMGKRCARKRCFL